MDDFFSPERKTGLAETGENGYAWEDDSPESYEKECPVARIAGRVTGP